MTSTKIFSVKKTSILVVAVFTMAITLGLGPVSSSMALTDFINCNTEVDGHSNVGQINTVKSCHEEINKGDVASEKGSSNSKETSGSASDDEADNENGNNVDVGKSTQQNIATNAPAVASSDDNIIKPINLNKGFDSDKPLQTDNVQHVSASDDNNDKIQSKKVVEDEASMDPNINLDKSASMSELYESFNLPYTALYKNQ